MGLPPSKELIKEMRKQGLHLIPWRHKFDKNQTRYVNLKTDIPLLLRILSMTRLFHGGANILRTNKIIQKVACIVIRKYYFQVFCIS